MSSTSTKRPRREAGLDAEALKALFAPDCYAKWFFGGSLRRGVADVNDVEHIVMPFVGFAPGDGLFADPKPVNMLWHRLDELVAAGAVRKHVYGETGNRWGPLYRGIDYRGHMHEFFTADETNLGSVLAIRTGPPDFSRKLVTGLLRKSRRNKDGKVWRCFPCPMCSQDEVNDKCGRCQGTHLEPIEVIPVPTEQAFFELAGLAYLPPERRF